MKTTSTATDGELVQAVAGGDRAALAGLYDRYAAPLLAAGRRFGGVQGEAEDLVHDVFLEVWRRAGDYDPARGSVRAWLMTRMRSRTLDRLKAPARARAVSLGTDEVGALEAAGAGEDPQLGPDRRAAWRALAGLRADHRAVLLMRYAEGLSSSQIAARAGVPLGTVKGQANRALARLRLLFGAPAAALA